MKLLFFSRNIIAFAHETQAHFYFISKLNIILLATCMPSLNKKKKKKIMVHRVQTVSTTESARLWPHPHFISSFYRSSLNFCCNWPTLWPLCRLCTLPDIAIWNTSEGGRLTRAAGVYLYFAWLLLYTATNCAADAAVGEFMISNEVDNTGVSRCSEPRWN